jgi:hypothetical protein
MGSEKALIIKLNANVEERQLTLFEQISHL